MNIIEQIELKNFRSFGNRKQESYKVSKCQSLNIISGANDSGKSNILRALNLFFNKRTDLNSFLDFEKDFFKKEEIDANEIKEELITIKIWFHNPKNAGKNQQNKSNIFLPEKFWVSRKWKKSSEFSQFDQMSSIEKDFEIEKKDDIQNFIDNHENGSKNLKTITRASLLKQLTDFINSIQFQYVPAIKDSNYFSHLYGELQHTLWKTKISTVEGRKNDFEKAIQNETNMLMEEFKNSISGNSNIEPIFQLPYDLINLFRALVVKTGNVDLTLRGDGYQAKLIPEILNFIAVKEQSFTTNSIKKEYKAKKYFIWGFEEPENSYEYKNASILAERFKYIFSKNAQIFITTHSFNFLSLRGKEIGIYRVWKDTLTNGSKLTKLKFNAQGNIKFDNMSNNSEWEDLQDELGFFYLNEELNTIYLQKQKHLALMKAQVLEINKAVIYSEGHNFKYLEKAKEFHGNNLLLDLKDCGGKNDLHQLFKTLIKTDFKRFKTFFIFDCDAKTEYQSCKEMKTAEIIPILLPKNPNNTYTELQKGIENMFDNEVLDLIEEQQLFDVSETMRNNVLINRTRIPRKKKLEDFIIRERNDEIDFKNFQPIFEIIRSNLK